MRIACPVAGCNWQTEDHDVATLGAVLAAKLSVHGAGLHQGNAAAAGGNVKKPDRPEIKEDVRDQE